MKQQTPHNTEKSSSRQQRIEECFLQNLAKLPYDQISVAELCRQMGISRRLYYTYFQDKETCLFSLIDRMVQASFDGIYQIPHKPTHHDTAVIYLSYWKKHSDFLDVVVKQNLKALLIERSYLYFKKNPDVMMPMLSTPDVDADDSILWLFAAIRFTVLMQWHENGYDLPVEKMAVKYLRMLQQPLITSSVMP